MMRRAIANALFALHFLIGAFFLSGWLFPQIKYIYLPLLISWPLSWIFLGYCPLTKWEFRLRKQTQANLDTDTEFIQYYAQKFFGWHIPTKVIFMSGMIVFALLLGAFFVRTF